MKNLIYRRVQSYIVPPYWMKSAYFDYRVNSAIYVVFPLNYIVQFVWFLNLAWCKFKNKLSWIDKLKKELDNSKFGAQCIIHELEYDKKTLIKENEKLTNLLNEVIGLADLMSDEININWCKESKLAVGKLNLIIKKVGWIRPHENYHNHIEKLKEGLEEYKKYIGSKENHQ